MTRTRPCGCSCHILPWDVTHLCILCWPRKVGNGLSPGKVKPGWCRSSLPGCVVSTIFSESILMYQHCNINVCNASQMQGCEFASQVRAQGAQSRPKSWPWSIQTPKRLSFSMLQLPKNLAVGDGRTQLVWRNWRGSSVEWAPGWWLIDMHQSDQSVTSEMETQKDQSNSFCCAICWLETAEMEMPRCWYY